MVNPNHWFQAAALVCTPIRVWVSPTPITWVCDFLEDPPPKDGIPTFPSAGHPNGCIDQRRIQMVPTIFSRGIMRGESHTKGWLMSSFAALFCRLARKGSTIAKSGIDELVADLSGKAKALSCWSAGRCSHHMAKYAIKSPPQHLVECVAHARIHGVTPFFILYPNFCCSCFSKKEMSPKFRGWRNHTKNV